MIKLSYFYYNVSFYECEIHTVKEKKLYDLKLYLV